MEIIVSVGGRFHAFNLAQQLLKRGHLRKLITSYPKFEVKKYGIPPEKTESIFIKEILERAWRRLPETIKNLYNPQYFIHEVFDILASRKIERSDVFNGFSSFSLHSLREAKKKGAITVLERGSSHIAYQDEILREEYGLTGVKPSISNFPHPKIIKKELEEYKEADYINVPSLFAKRTFIEKGFPESRLMLIPYGVDLKQFYGAKKEDDIFRVIYVGGMTVQKGVHYLLRAFAGLNLPNSELLLVGAMSEEMKPFFKRYEGKFKYVSQVPQGRLVDYYNKSSVFVLNSIQDGFGMVIIQAMACGLPVICTTNTGGADIAREGIDGFIIPIRSVDALKQKLLFLFENPKIREEMGRSAKERVSRGFTWDDYGEKMIAEYKRILSLKK
ncbi:MAG: glycosyltransferase family 4 protein [Candidatus Wolfebacteria bacterium]|nr:glycosyltransferase family 4 protein [Candidatus Wolfebacteria bacterium]